MQLRPHLLRGLFRRRISPDEDSCFDADARQVLRRAREVAGAEGAPVIAGEHLLAAIAAEPASSAAAVLRRLDVSLPTLSAAIAGELGTRPAGTAAVRSPALAYTSGARRVVGLAIRAAQVLGHRHVSSAHLLLALAEERLDAPARILTGLGVELTAAQAATSQTLAADLADSGAW